MRSKHKKLPSLNQDEMNDALHEAFGEKD